MDKTKLQINNEDVEKVAKLTQKSHTQELVASEQGNLQ
jgi:hypothetical protein